MTEKYIGSTFLLAGTTLGAGMLALPLVAAKVGFFYSVLLLILVWAIMCYTGLLVLEVNLAFEPYRNNFDSMAHKTLGYAGKALAWITCLCLLYSLTAAYVAGDSSLLLFLFHKLGWNLPHWFGAGLFVLVLGGAVYWHTKVVDWLNRFLFSAKGVFLILALVLLLPHVDVAKIARNEHGLSSVWLCVPVFLCAFGYHTIIPSLTNYIGKEAKILRRVIITGTIVPLFLYILWLFVVLAVVPLKGTHSFTAIAAKHGSVGSMMHAIDAIINSRWVAIGVNGFSNIAMTTSFLGVSLGLFDFLADAFNRKNTRIGRSQTALLTFVLPLLFAIFFPNGFVSALKYAAIFVAILEIILPVLMVYKLRKSKDLSSCYRVKGHVFILLLILLLGLGVVVLGVI